MCGSRRLESPGRRKKSVIVKRSKSFKIAGIGGLAYLAFFALLLGMSSDVDFDFIRRVRAAQGYVELGMPREALEELGALPEASQNRIEAILMRMEILRFLKQWEECATMGQLALGRHGECGGLYLITAYAVRRSQGLERAKALLLSGESVLKEEAMFHFNIACYECQLGNLNCAKERLQRAFALDPKYRNVGKEDPDLTPLRDWLASET